MQHRRGVLLGVALLGTGCVTSVEREYSDRELEGSVDALAASDTTCVGAERCAWEERALIFGSGRWVDASTSLGRGGAFRGTAPPPGGPADFYAMWTGDNALMLWALTAGDRFAFSNAAAHDYPGSIFGFILRHRRANGDFSPGEMVSALDPTDVRPFAGDVQEVAMPTQVLFGLTAFTHARGNDDGNYAVLNELCTKQYELVMQRVRGAVGTPRFDAPADVAFLMAALANRYAQTGEPLHQNRALRLWNWLRAQQRPNGTFDGATLRNVQIHYLIRHTRRLLQDKLESEGLVSSKLNRGFMVRDGYVQAAGLAPDYGEQVHAYRLLSGDERALAGHRKNRLSLYGGWLFAGNTTSTHEGPIEAQALGFRVHAEGIF